ncbi:hypothetical protein B0A50_04301 [Salinomyces thailandicus]|uniref:Uncharacterized protein n=1 Tax=Salinomyces thailandicus TaxID=706561 RepID=A0A4U0TYJ7_9PEZI|nr:hypothetical protein B0A50_04301 [Salinomyces thailandica]
MHPFHFQQQQEQRQQSSDPNFSVQQPLPIQPSTPYRAHLQASRSLEDQSAAVLRHLPSNAPPNPQTGHVLRGQSSPPETPAYVLRRREIVRDPSPSNALQTPPRRLIDSRDGSPATLASSAGDPAELSEPESEPDHPDALTYTSRNIDLNSAAAAQTIDLRLTEAGVYDEPIYILTTAKPVAVCMNTKQWLLEQLSGPDFAAPGILRMETLALHDLDDAKEGRVVLMQGAVHLGGDPERPVTILAVSAKGDKHLRFFYTILPIGPLLKHLDDFNCLSEPVTTVLQPHTHKHKRLFTFLTQAFLTAIRVPDHPDFIEAQRITDYCPSILDPTTAFDRLEANETLYFANNGVSEPRDLAKDRYTHSLHPAESSLAADLRMRCSAYLLFKRKFFRAFYYDCVALRERIGAGNAKVRTEHAHEVWIVQQMRWRVGRVRRLLLAWRILGFLEERRFLPWLKAGGMLQGDVAEQEEVEGEEAEAVRGVMREVRRGGEQGRRSGRGSARGSARQGRAK